MINSIVCAAPAGFDGSGRVRVSALPWSALLGTDRTGMGGALPTGTSLRGAEQPAVPTARPATGDIPVVTTNAYTTLGIHSPGRPQS